MAKTKRIKDGETVLEAKQRRRARSGGAGGRGERGARAEQRVRRPRGAAGAASLQGQADAGDWNASHTLVYLAHGLY